MSDNVRCAGDGILRLIQGGIAGPCGWAGRLDGWARDSLTSKGGVTPPTCPECGGKVELIERSP